MNQTSPAATGTAGAAIACLVAIIAPINNRLGLGLTAQDLVSVAGGIVVGAHWLAQQYAARMAKTNALKSLPPGTQVSITPPVTLLNTAETAAPATAQK